MSIVTEQFAAMSRYAPSAMSRRNSEVPLLCGNKRKASSRLGDTSKEYCQNTSLHGFQYLGKIHMRRPPKAEVVRKGVA